MYTVRFNTSGFESKNRRDWEQQLYNDYMVEINGMEFDCKDEESLKNRFNFICGYSNNINQSDNENHIIMESEKYGKQFMALKVPAIPQGYVSFDRILNEINKSGKYSISFNSLYDTRQSPFFKGCYIEIIKNNK